MYNLITPTINALLLCTATARLQPPSPPACSHRHRPPAATVTASLQPVSTALHRQPAAHRHYPTASQSPPVNACLLPAVTARHHQYDARCPVTARLQPAVTSRLHPTVTARHRLACSPQPSPPVPSPPADTASHRLHLDGDGE